jgi:tripartite-type tricarboxylate transporter receptor subunit TctC
MGGTKMNAAGKLDTSFDRVKRTAFLWAITVVALLMTAPADAQGPSAGSGSASSISKEDPYPTMPIKLIVPYQTGGPSDMLARVAGTLMGKELKQSVVVFNRPGAGSAVGMKALEDSKPDGYTIGLATSALISNKYMSAAHADYTKLTPLALLLNSPGALAVRADASWKGLQDFLRETKAKGGGLAVGNTGAGATWDLMGLVIQDKGGITFTAVPYNGGAPLLSGEITAGLQSVSGWTPNAKSGKLRILAVASEQRDPIFPEVPTFREQGFDLVYGLWTGFFAPKGTPAHIVAKLSDLLLTISKNPEFVSYAEKSGFDVAVKGPTAFASFLKMEDERIGSIAKRFNLKSK